MIESVGTLLVYNSTLRSSSQSQAAYSSASNTLGDSQAFVVSRIRMDNLQNMAILEYRSEKGEVIDQYPTQSQIRAFKQAERLEDNRHQAVQAAHDSQVLDKEVASLSGGRGATAPSAAPVVSHVESRQSVTPVAVNAPSAAPAPIASAGSEQTVSQQSILV